MDTQHKLVMAIMQESDYDSTLAELSQRQIFLTRLSSTGGFFKKKNVTVMIGVEESRLDEVLKVLQVCAGKRNQQVCMMPTPTGDFAAEAPISLDADAGGVTVFVMNMEQLKKF